MEFSRFMDLLQDKGVKLVYMENYNEWQEWNPEIEDTYNKQKGESQNVSRATTSLSYMAIYRNKRDRYCAQRLEKYGRIASATSSFYLQHKKLQNKHKKIIKKC